MKGLISFGFDQDTKEKSPDLKRKRNEDEITGKAFKALLNIEMKPEPDQAEPITLDLTNESSPERAPREPELVMAQTDTSQAIQSLLTLMNQQFGEYDVKTFKKH